MAEEIDEYRPLLGAAQCNQPAQRGDLTGRTHEGDLCRGIAQHGKGIDRVALQVLRPGAGGELRGPPGHHVPGTPRRGIVPDAAHGISLSEERLGQGRGRTARRGEQPHGGIRMAHGPAGKRFDGRRVLGQKGADAEALPARRAAVGMKHAGAVEPVAVVHEVEQRMGTGGGADAASVAAGEFGDVTHGSQSVS